jgi:hypothetical protein
MGRAADYINRSSRPISHREVMGERLPVCQDHAKIMLLDWWLRGSTAAVGNAGTVWRTRPITGRWRHTDRLPTIAAAQD